MMQLVLAASAIMSMDNSNYFISCLLEKRLIKLQNFKRNKRKLASSYLLAPSFNGRKSSSYTKASPKKMEEHELLRSEIELLKQEAADV